MPLKLHNFKGTSWVWASDYEKLEKINEQLEKEFQEYARALSHERIKNGELISKADDALKLQAKVNQLEAKNEEMFKDNVDLMKYVEKFKAENEKQYTSGYYIGYNSCEIKLKERIAKLEASRRRLAEKCEELDKCIDSHTDQDLGRSTEWYLKWSEEHEV